MENELNEMFTDWYPETPISYDFDNINKRKVIFWTIFAMATTVAYEVGLSRGIEYIVNQHNKNSGISVKQPIKQPAKTLSFYQAINNEKVKE